MLLSYRLRIRYAPGLLSTIEHLLFIFYCFFLSPSVVSVCSTLRYTTPFGRWQHGTVKIHRRPDFSFIAYASHRQLALARMFSKLMWSFAVGICRMLCAIAQHFQLSNVRIVCVCSEQTIQFVCSCWHSALGIRPSGLTLLLKMLSKRTTDDVVVVWTTTTAHRWHFSFWCCNLFSGAVHCIRCSDVAMWCVSVCVCEEQFIATGLTDNISRNISFTSVCNWRD